MDTIERQLIQLELAQRREEGCDVAALQARVEKALDDEPRESAVFVDLYDELDALEPAPSFPYEEPSDLEGIRALRPDGPRRMDLDLSDDAVRDRIYGAWLGRAAGCSLGKPIEGWPGSVSTSTWSRSVRCRSTTTSPTPKARSVQA